ncbi:MAG: glycosyltransferase [Mucilaginibacter sp.]
MLKQRFNRRQYEIIVVSDGPDNETRQLIREFRDGYKRIRFFELPLKKGPAAARNFGWLNAKADIIAFTDDDCMPDEYWLAEIRRNISPNSLQAVTGKVIVPRSKRPTDYAKNTAGLEDADFVTANCACSKAALLRTGGFDEQFSMAWREDSDLEFKLISQRIPVKKVNSAVVVHPVRDAKWGVSIKDQRKTLYNALLYKKYPELYRQKIQPSPPIIYYAIISAFICALAGFVIGAKAIALTGLLIWLTLTVYFTVKRLYAADRSPTHIAEMVVTSFVIPFLAIYWQWYGAIKYKVLFI